MKADKEGVRSERIRFYFGWLNASQCKAEGVSDGNRCRHCLHAQTGDGSAWYCCNLHIPTIARARCIAWEEKSES